MGHILTKLHQFLIRSFRDFVRTDTQTDAQTPPKTIFARSGRAGKYYCRVCRHMAKVIWRRPRRIFLSLLCWIGTPV